MEGASALAPVSHFRNYIKYGFPFPEPVFQDVEEARKYIIPGLQTARDLVATTNLEVAQLIVTEGQIQPERVLTERLRRLHIIVDKLFKEISLIERLVIEGIGDVTTFSDSLTNLRDECQALHRELETLNTERHKNENRYVVFLFLGILVVPCIFKIIIESTKAELEGEEKSARRSSAPSSSAPPSPAPSTAGMTAMAYITIWVDALTGIIPFLFPIVWKHVYGQSQKMEQKLRNQMLSLEYVERAIEIIISIIPTLTALVEAAAAPVDPAAPRVDPAADVDGDHRININPDVGTP